MVVLIIRLGIAIMYGVVVLGLHEETKFQGDYGLLNSESKMLLLIYTVFAVACLWAVGL